MKERKIWDHKYLCIGENYRSDVPIGDCGDVHTLGEWIDKFFPSPSEKQLGFFSNAKENDIIEYIYQHKEKRLVKDK